jgi:hypothetical protein
VTAVPNLMTEVLAAAAANTGSGSRPSRCGSQTRGTPSDSSLANSPAGPMRVRGPLSRLAMIA